MSAPSAAPPGTPLQSSRAEFLQSFRWATRGRGAPKDLVTALGTAAYELVLPPPWTEESSSAGVVYFWNSSTNTSSWQHPLMDVFLCVLDALMLIIRDCLSVADLASALTAHLRHADEEAEKKLEGWSMHEQGRLQYFYNASTGESCWENPADFAQHELHAQYWLLGRFVQHFYGDMALSGEGRSFLTALGERVNVPDEVKDYAAWIQASVASSSPVAQVPTPQRRTRPPLPPLTALPLKADADPLEPHLAFLVRAPSVDPSPEVRFKRAQSSGQLERRKRTHPPLTKYPLRRSLMIWKPVAEEDLRSGQLQARRAQTGPF
ncbi:WW domain-containing protein [Durusdinium trenchii]|uniref:WW domain-containing protein n=1 Tax=Durusdinium trenchii TaxID=1381693 RepID=A0ABP0PYC8_9DINO